MHPHLIDWFRSVDINPNPAVVEHRWETAGLYAEQIVRTSLLNLLRLFLFPSPDVQTCTWLTDGLLALDKEFPVSNNAELLRLMAGVIMVRTFDPPSKEGDAFAIGLRAFGDRIAVPAQPEISAEAKRYLQAEAQRVRPGNFANAAKNVEAALTTSHKTMREAENGGESPTTADAQQRYHKAISEAISALGVQVRRLAEESNLLWWVVGEYSISLGRSTTEVPSLAYALVAAAEAADRTHILPPPPSADALLDRALKPCKTSKGALKLIDFLTAADSQWRADLLRNLTFADCSDFVPMVTGLSKFQELGDQPATISVLPRLCPGFDIKRPLSPPAAAQQFYAELMFLKALSMLEAG